ncbi:MAG: hypothetical protein Q7S65_00640, partial [Nanoarchaeota archaeon]|nr:hypothetical protein [Nanoarchaeota archaeon]
HRVEKNHAYITGTPLEAPQKDVLYRALYEYLRRDIPSGAPTSIPPVPVVSEMAEYTVRSADGLETPSTTGAVLRLLGGTRFFPFEGYARPGDQLNETSIAPLQQALRSVDQVVMNPISFEACAVVKTVPGGKVVLPIEFGILRLIHYQKIFAGVSRNL